MNPSTVNAHIRAVQARYEYAADGRFDRWRIMRGDVLRGDCEDFVLTVYARCFGGWWGMVKALMRGDCHIWFARLPNGDGHAVGEVCGEFFDNGATMLKDKGAYAKALRHRYSRPRLVWKLGGYASPVLLAAVLSAALSAALVLLVGAQA